MGIKNDQNSLMCCCLHNNNGIARMLWNESDSGRVNKWVGTINQARGRVNGCKC
jgi:hypothetical protein